jgi:hypothetical protein
MGAMKLWNPKRISDNKMCVWSDTLGKAGLPKGDVHDELAAVFV